jgi:ABC-2 type transport system permease protein
MIAAVATATDGRTLTQVTHVAKRSAIRTIRQPLLIVPSLIFPVLLLAVLTGGAGEATSIPGFPTDSYLTFLLAFTFMQGALFATNMAGTNVAEDISTGFFNRLSLTPLRGAAMLAGSLTGALMLGVVQAFAYIVVGLVAGAEIAAGPGGVPVIIALALLVNLAFGSIGLAAGLRVGSGEALQGLFPVLFVVLFLSSMTLPRELIQEDWFQTVATINPVSYLIEGFRSLLITGWDLEALALAFGIAAAILAGGLAWASSSLKMRLVRT